MALFEPIFEALNRDDVRYVVVGGVAVVLHGYARLTADLDLAVDLDPPEARKAIQSLSGLGLRPSAPVAALGFADPAIRTGWIDEKGMTVFSLRDPADPMRQVDLFTESPIPFEELWSRSVVLELGGLQVRVASIPDLIDMKRSAGRPIDLRDVEELRAIAEDRTAPMDGHMGASPTVDGWEAHREEQREGWLSATPGQRLAWLEAAIAFAYRAGALPRRPAPSGHSTPSQGS